MTTKVSVTAHCATTKEVHIDVSTEHTGERIVLQDGESCECVVYDNRTISVSEAEKADAKAA